MIERMYHPMDKIGVDTSIVTPAHIARLSLVDSQYHQPTAISVIIRKILEASLGVDPTSVIHSRSKQPIYPVHGRLSLTELMNECLFQPDN